MGANEITPELVPIAIVARHKRYLYPYSLESCERMCRNKDFKTAVKLGPGRKAHWFVSVAEVLDYKLKRHASQMQYD